MSCFEQRQAALTGPCSPLWQSVLQKFPVPCNSLSTARQRRHKRNKQPKHWVVHDTQRCSTQLELDGALAGGLGVYMMPQCSLFHRGPPPRRSEKHKSQFRGSKRSHRAVCRAWALPVTLQRLQRCSVSETQQMCLHLSQRSSEQHWAGHRTHSSQARPPWRQTA